MRVAVIYRDDHVYVEYTPEEFKKLLKEYLKDMSIEEAMDQIVLDIKEETRH